MSRYLAQVRRRSMSREADVALSANSTPEKEGSTAMVSPVSHSKATLGSVILSKGTLHSDACL